MFSALILTAGVALLFGYLFSLWYAKDPNRAAGMINLILAISGIGTVVVMLIMNFASLKNGKGVKVGFYVFAGLMGITLSTLTIYTQNTPILGIAFGLTSLIFAAMWGIAAIGKEKLAPLAVVGLGLLSGALLVSLFTWIVALIIRPTQSTLTLLWVLDFVIFGAIMLITIVDMARIQTILKQANVSDNTAIFCACTLYIDFIYIFVRLAYFLIILTAQNK